MQRVANYDMISSQYDCRYQVREFRGIQNALLNFVRGPNSSKLLEVGCGTGHWLQFLSNHEFVSIGIDPSIRMLLQCRGGLPNWPLVRGISEALPFPRSYFDRVFCINAFHHFTQKTAFLSEARRVLRSSGGLMIIGLDPHTGLDEWWVYDYFPEALGLDKKRYPPAADITDLLTRYQFTRCKIVEVEHIEGKMPAQVAAAKGLFGRGFTSQLTILSEEEYQSGLRRLNEGIEEATSVGEHLSLTTDLRLYAVVGWM
jgi:ubiquinone/menaquinone biosynthesis C-methylase UbiE